MSAITQAKLKELFCYNQESGVFTRRIATGRHGCHPVGSVAGSINGHVTISINSKKYKAHRLAFLYMTGEFPEGPVDHKDKNKLNNAWENIRTASKRLNSINQHNREDNSSGVKGVVWSVKKCAWVAKICDYGKNMTIGSSVDFVEAVCMRLAFEQCLGWDDILADSPSMIFMRGYLTGVQQRPKINSAWPEFKPTF